MTANIPCVAAIIRDHRVISTKRCDHRGSSHNGRTKLRIDSSVPKARLMAADATEFPRWGANQAQSCEVSNDAGTTPGFREALQPRPPSRLLTRHQDPSFSGPTVQQFIQPGPWQDERLAPWAAKRAQPIRWLIRESESPAERSRQLACSASNVELGKQVQSLLVAIILSEFEGTFTRDGTCIEQHFSQLRGLVAKFMMRLPRSIALNINRMFQQSPTLIRYGINRRASHNEPTYNLNPLLFDGQV